MERRAAPVRGARPRRERGPEIRRWRWPIAPLCAQSGIWLLTAPTRVKSWAGEMARDETQRTRA